MIKMVEVPEDLAPTDGLTNVSIQLRSVHMGDGAARTFRFAFELHRHDQYPLEVGHIDIEVGAADDGFEGL